jgi:hypothetical protein
VLDQSLEAASQGLVEISIENEQVTLEIEAYWVQVARSGCRPLTVNHGDFLNSRMKRYPGKK